MSAVRRAQPTRNRSSVEEGPPHKPEAPSRERPPTREPDGRSQGDKDGLVQHEKVVEDSLPQHRSSDGEPAPRPSTPDAELPLLGYENRGAVGYPSPDESLQQEVLVALEAKPKLDSGRLSVSVTNGVVTLRGKVRSEKDRKLAEDTASACPGIERVKNQLRVTDS
jgi:hypothetical protein